MIDVFGNGYRDYLVRLNGSGSAEPDSESQWRGERGGGSVK